MSDHTNQFYLICGPSCIGKSPLISALRQLEPDLMSRFVQPVLYNSRAPRPGEKDGEHYHFRTRDVIENMRNRDEFIVEQMRGDLVAIDAGEIISLLKQGPVLFEGNPFAGRLFMEHPSFREVAKRSCLLSPLSRDEVHFLKERSSRVDVPAFVEEVMRAKLLKRTQKQRGILSRGDLDMIERRSSSAYRELSLAPLFDMILPNHDGEDSDNWSRFGFPVGDAWRTVCSATEFLKGVRPRDAESWDDGLLPPLTRETE